MSPARVYGPKATPSRPSGAIRKIAPRTVRPSLRDDDDEEEDEALDVSTTVIEVTSVVTVATDVPEVSLDVRSDV